MRKIIIYGWLSLLLVLTIADGMSFRGRDRLRTIILNTGSFLEASETSGREESQKPETETPPGPNPEPQTTQIKELIKQLGDNAWPVREKATQTLIELSKSSYETVALALDKTLSSSEDPEVRLRAKLVLSVILSRDFLLAQKGIKIKPAGEYDSRGITTDNFQIHLEPKDTKPGEVKIEKLIGSSDPKGWVKGDKRLLVEMKCEAYKDSCIIVTPESMPEGKKVSLEGKPLMEAWIYPTQTGDTCGEYGCAVLAVALRNTKTDETVSLSYTWSGYNHWKENRTKPNISKAEKSVGIAYCLFDWESNKWHQLKIDFLTDIRRTEACEVEHPADWQVETISFTCHYSNGNPGTFYIEIPRLMPAEDK